MLRWRLELRGAAGVRSRLVSLLVALPGLLLLSSFAAFFAFTLGGMLERGRPGLTLSLVSAGAAVFGLSWALSPLLAGISATETHDLGRLVHFPIPLRVLVLSSLLANLLQPVVVMQLPPLLALSLALAGPGVRLVPAVAGLLLALGLCLAAGQLAGVTLHALSRHRRWHDRVLFAGIGLGVVLSLLPLVVLGASHGALRALALGLLERDVFALVPFAWGARAAVHGARGQLGAFAGWAGAAALAIGAVVAVSTRLADGLYRGDLDLGDTRGVASRPGRLRLPGALGALVEKELRVSWRDPRLKALVFTGVIGPALVLVALWQGSGERIGPGVMLSLASIAGLGVLGANAFGQERQAAALLFSFPLDRVRILVAKNLATMLLRLPALVLVVLATVVASGVWLLPAVVTVVLLTELVAAALDNFVSVLAPFPAPAAGRDPTSAIAGARGLGAAVIALAAMVATLLLSAPFAFLAWLPHLLSRHGLWVVALPLALAGAGAVYFMLVSWAARIVERREPELVARVAGEW